MSSEALASISYSPAGLFGVQGSGPGELTLPTKIAVDADTGTILVVDASQGRVQVYAPGEGGPTYLTEFGAGEMSSPAGIAIDQSSGAVYVGDAGSGEIVRYISDRQPVPTYTLDPTFASPTAGSGPEQVGSFGSSLAVDPRNGDLLIGDIANHRVMRLAPTGAASFDGSDSPSGSFGEIADIAVDSTGATYVVNVTSNPEGVVEKFDSTGSFVMTLPHISQPGSVAFDATTGNLAVAGGVGFGGAPPHLYVFHGDALASQHDFPTADAGSMVPGMAFEGGAAPRLYATLGIHFGQGLVAVQVFNPIGHPDVALEPTTGITPRTAHIAGTVNPAGTETVGVLEYSPDGSNWTLAAIEFLGSGTDPVTMATDLDGLTPNTKYFVRLTASNGVDEPTTPPAAFTTLSAAPDVITGQATDRHQNQVTLRGTLRAYGSAATYHFEFGSSTNYDSRVPIGKEAPAGSGNNRHQVAQTVGGLVPGFTYHYRLVASNGLGESVGEDRTFVLATTASPDRAYEMVSPVEKSGASVGTRFGFRAAPDGNAISYTTIVPGANGFESNAAPRYPQYLAHRNASGWLTAALDPQQAAASVANLFFFATVAVSEDGSHSVGISLKKLAPNASDGDSNVYLRDVRSGTLTTIASFPGAAVYAAGRTSFGEGTNVVPGGTADFSHVILSGGNAPLLPGATASSLYEWEEGNLRLVSIGPDGDPLTGGSIGSAVDRQPHYISSDGRSIFFNSEGSVYVRIGGAETLPVSVAPGAPAGSEPIPGVFVGASTNGHVAFFRSGSAIYRNDLDAREVTAVTPDSSEAIQVRQIDAEGDYVYYLDAGTLKVWHDGATLSIASANPKEWIASASGRYFAFTTYTQLTDYSNASTACRAFNFGDPGNACLEVYRYDAATQELICASCRPDGDSPTGNALFGEAISNINHHFAQAVSDSGEVFFDTPDDLVARDVNSSRDVYAFRDGQATLVSSGTGSGRSEFADATPDGSNVFFTTQDRLVGQDRDSEMDLYDARVGGGSSSQNADPRLTCMGEECRQSSRPPESKSSVGSEVVQVGGNPNRRAQKRCRKSQSKGKRSLKQRCARHGKRQDRRVSR